MRKLHTNATTVSTQAQRNVSPTDQTPPVSSYQSLDIVIRSGI